MKVGSWVALVMIPLCVILLLGGCDTTSVSQNREKAVIWIGNNRLPDLSPAQPFSRELLPYALLAARAYDDVDDNGFTPDDKTTLKDIIGEAKPWLENWFYVNDMPSPGTCASDRRWCIPLEGLGVQIWRHQPPDAVICDEVVIAFRGTNFDSSEDWLANFRWFTRLLPVHDQYDQVYELMPKFMALLDQEPCFKPSTRLITTGHSLGGGLAQLAAYREGRVEQVYAFDPSSVTGFYMVPTEISDCTRQGLKIERVYERNEVLAYLRFIMKLLYTVDHQNPQIRSIRFNVTSGESAISQHSIVTLAKALLEWAGKPTDTVPVAKLPDWVPAPGEKIEQVSEKRRVCPPENDKGVVAAAG